MCGINTKPNHSMSGEQRTRFWAEDGATTEGYDTDLIRKRFGNRISLKVAKTRLPLGHENIRHTHASSFLNQMIGVDKGQMKMLCHARTDSTFTRPGCTDHDCHRALSQRRGHEIAK
jgi:hypothetical protein